MRHSLVLIEHVISVSFSFIDMQIELTKFLKSIATSVCMSDQQFPLNETSQEFARQTLVHTHTLLLPIRPLHVHLAICVSVILCTQKAKPIYSHSMFGIFEGYREIIFNHYCTIESMNLNPAWGLFVWQETSQVKGYMYFLSL